MRALWLVATLAIVGCASTPTPKAASIVEADERMVVECKFLGSVFGDTAYGGFANDLAANNAKVDLLEKAAKLGATHVVITSLHGGSLSSQGKAEGRAYLCN